MRPRASHRGHVQRRLPRGAAAVCGGFQRQDDRGWRQGHGRAEGSQQGSRSLAARPGRREQRRRRIDVRLTAQVPHGDALACYSITACYSLASTQCAGVSACRAGHMLDEGLLNKALGVRSSPPRTSRHQPRQQLPALPSAASTPALQGPRPSAHPAALPPRRWLTARRTSAPAPPGRAGQPRRPPAWRAGPPPTPGTPSPARCTLEPPPAHTGIRVRNGVHGVLQGGKVQYKHI